MRRGSSPRSRKEDHSMETLEAIATRRSNRQFRADPIPQDVLEKILNAAIMAPSGKNRQPWRFVVVREDKRERDGRADARGHREFKARGEDIGSAEGTAAVMAQAPVTVFVFNTDGKPPWLDHSIDELSGKPLHPVRRRGDPEHLPGGTRRWASARCGSATCCTPTRNCPPGWARTRRWSPRCRWGIPADNPVVFSRKPLTDVTVWF